MANLAKRMAIEAAAIGAYESFVRKSRTPNQYPDWAALKVAERQSWRYRVVEIVKVEVA